MQARVAVRRISTFLDLPDLVGHVPGANHRKEESMSTHAHKPLVQPGKSGQEPMGHAPEPTDQQLMQDQGGQPGPRHNQMPAGHVSDDEASWRDVEPGGSALKQPSLCRATSACPCRANATAPPLHDCATPPNVLAMQEDHTAAAAHMERALASRGSNPLFRRPGSLVIRNLSCSWDKPDGQLLTDDPTGISQLLAGLGIVQDVADVESSHAAAGVQGQWVSNGLFIDGDDGDVDCQLLPGPAAMKEFASGIPSQAQAPTGMEQQLPPTNPSTANTHLKQSNQQLLSLRRATNSAMLVNPGLITASASQSKAITGLLSKSSTWAASESAHQEQGHGHLSALGSGAHNKAPGLPGVHLAEVTFELQPGELLAVVGDTGR